MKTHTHHRTILNIFAAIAAIAVFFPQQAPAEEFSVAYKLASLDTGDTNLNKESVVIMRYQKYLTLLSKRFEQSEEQIADQTWAVVKYLQKKDVKTTAIDLMKGAEKIENPKEMGMDYSSTIAAIATLMIAQAVDQ